jgi:hypothetical protein
LAKHPRLRRIPIPWGIRTQISAGVIAGLLVVAGVVWFIVSRESSATLQPPEVVGGQHVDYSIKNSLVALIASTDLVCQCTVTSSTPPYTATPRIDGKSGAGPAGASTTQQEFQLSVDRVLRATTPPPSTLSVVQAGTRGDRTAASEDPPLIVGSRYVLFLKRGANGKYGIVGGPQGRLLVDAENRLHPILESDRVTAILRNRTVEQVIGLLRPGTPGP